MNKSLIGLVLIVSFASCKSKESDSTKAYFSVIDYLKAEVKKMDTLPLRFIKITTENSTSDTITVTKDEFSKYAKEFTSVPDISSDEKRSYYTETNDFDEILNNVLLIYTAKRPAEEVRNETIMMVPDDMGNTHIKTIIVTTLKAQGDSTIEKNMTWHIDKRFQIVTKVNIPGQPEKISTVVLSWK